MMDKIEHMAHLVTLMAIAAECETSDIINALSGDIISEEEAGKITRELEG